MQEWLHRVATDISSIKNSKKLSTRAKLQKVQNSYEILSVIIKVAEGRAYMAGVQPPKGI